MYPLSKTTSPMARSVWDKQHGPLELTLRLKFAEMNIWGEKGPSYAETVGFITIDKGTWYYYSNKFARAELFIIKLRFMQYFLERSMELVQRILWISVYLIYDFFCFFLFAYPPALVVVLFRLWFCWAPF